MNNIYNVPLNPSQQKAYDQMMEPFEKGGSDLFRDMVYLGNVVAAHDVCQLGILFKQSKVVHSHINWHAINAFNGYKTFAGLMPAFFDVLSPLHHHLVNYNGGRRSLGQIFTPANIAEEMGCLSLNEHEIQAKEYVSIGDFACGAGACLLGILRAMEKMVPGSSKKAVIVGMDLDPLCCAMTTVQLMTNQFKCDSQVAMIKIENLDTIKDFNSHKPGHTWWICVNDKKALDFFKKAT